MNLKEARVRTSGGVYRKVIIEEPSTEYATSKMQARKRIGDEVFNSYDAIADNAKWLSILTTLVSRIYDAMPETQKVEMATEDRQLIEYAFSKFSASATRADVQVSEEGPTVVIDKLLDRQVKIGEIIGEQ
jgi:hypothetical protein